MLFIKFRNVLMKRDYPNINSMNDEEYAEVFTKENRLFFLNWMGKQLCSDYESALEQVENKQKFLEDLVFDFGFCTTSQKSHFVAGTSSNVEDEINIFNRIFSFLDVEDLTMLSFASDSHLELKGRSLNLFPEFGPIRTSKNRQKLQNAYNSIHSIASESTNNPESEIMNSQSIDIPEFTKEDQLKSLHTINQFLDTIKSIKNVKKPKNQSTTLNEASLRKLSETSKQLAQYFSNMKNLTSFDGTTEDCSEETSEATQAILEQSWLIDEIKTALNFFGVDLIPPRE